MTDFNSRSCEGATGIHRVVVWAFGISTHAPVKERLAKELEVTPEHVFQLTLL